MYFVEALKATSAPVGHFKDVCPGVTSRTWPYWDGEQRRREMDAVGNKGEEFPEGALLFVVSAGADGSLPTPTARSAIRVT